MLNTLALISNDLKQATQEYSMLQLINKIYYITFNHLRNNNKKDVKLTKDEYYDLADYLVKTCDFIVSCSMEYYSLDSKRSTYNIPQETLKNIKIKISELLIANNVNLFQEKLSENLKRIPTIFTEGN